MKGDGCGAVRLTDNPERSYGSQVWFRHLIPLLAAATTAAVASAGIADRLQPSQLVYLGAFRLPPVMSDSPAVWEWGGGAMTFSAIIHTIVAGFVARHFAVTAFCIANAL